MQKVLLDPYDFFTFLLDFNLNLSLFKDEVLNILNKLFLLLSLLSFDQYGFPSKEVKDGRWWGARSYHCKALTFCG